MSGQHTPGPWAVHPLTGKYGGYIVPAWHVERPVGGSTDVRADRDEYALKLCTVSKDPHGRNNVAADARLIAAAPELLQALEDLMDTGFTGGPQGDRAGKLIARLTASTTDAGVVG